MKNLIIQIRQDGIAAILQGTEENSFHGIAKYIEIPLPPAVLESDNIIRYQAFSGAIRKLVSEIRETDYRANTQNARVCIDCNLRFDIHNDRVTQEKEIQEETIQVHTPEVLKNKFINLDYIESSFRSIAFSAIKYSVYERGRVQPIVTLQNKDSDPAQLEGTRGSRIDAMVNIIQVRAEYLDSITKALTENDIVPLSVEPSCISILRLFQHTLDSNPSMTLYIGKKVSQIMISENFRVFAISSFNFGIETLAATIAENLDIHIEHIKAALFSYRNSFQNRTIIKRGTEISYKELRTFIAAECVEIIAHEVESFLKKHWKQRNISPDTALRNFSYICHQESNILNNVLNLISRRINSKFNINLKAKNLYENISEDFRKLAKNLTPETGQKENFVYAMLGCNRINLESDTYLFHRDYAGSIIERSAPQNSYLSSIRNENGEDKNNIPDENDLELMPSSKSFISTVKTRGQQVFNKLFSLSLEEEEEGVKEE